MSHRVDPGDFARRKAEAMQRAKQLKFNRNNAPDDNLTFKPKLVARPGYLDSIDIQAAKQNVNVIQAQLNSGDMFEKPLPATLQKAARAPANAPSPGSDALGHMIKTQSQARPRPVAPSAPSSSRAAQAAKPSFDTGSGAWSPPKTLSRAQAHTSQDAPAYVPAPLDSLGLKSARRERHSAAEVNAQFQSSLRPDEHQGSEVDAARSRRRPSVPSLATSSASAVAALSSRDSHHHLLTPTKSSLAAATTTTTPPSRQKHSPGKPSGPSGAMPFASPRTAGLVKSRLSLLKSKIRKSESAVTGLSSASRAPTGILSRSSSAPYSPNNGHTILGSAAAPVPRTTTAPGLSGSVSRSGNTAVSNSQSRVSLGGGGGGLSGAIFDGLPGAGAGGLEQETEQPQPQQQCEQCGRLFNAGPYARHVKICAKVFIEKRKVFDIKEKRIGDNPELVAMERRKSAPDARGRKAGAAEAAAALAAEVAVQEAKKKKVWKEQSGQFRQAMKAARGVAKAISEGGPMPEFKPSAPDPSMMQCPTCGRSFSQKAGERHIPQCKDIKAKPSRLSKGSGLGGGMQGTISAPSGRSALSKPPPGGKKAPKR